MAKKLGDDTPSQITVKLLVCLLKNDRFHTLGELAERFEVSKPTVIRSLERQDLSFFGELIKEKLGREVAYRIDKSRLINMLMRTQSRQDPWIRSKSRCAAHLPQSFISLKKRLGTRANPLFWAVLKQIMDNHA